MRKSVCLMASLSLVSVVPLAFGAGTIYEYNGTGTLLATTPVLSTTDLSLPLQATTEYVDIIPETNSSALPMITLTGGPSTGRVKIYLGQNLNATTPDFVNTSNAPAKYGNYLKGLDAIKGTNTTTNLATESEFYGGISGNFGVVCSPQPCNGTAYFIKVDRLVRFDVGGTMFGDITVAGESGWSPLIIEAGTMSAESSIAVNNGSITRLRTNGGTGLSGDLKCSVTVENGDINEIAAAARITGNAAGPIRVKRGKIRTITAGEGIFQNASDTNDIPSNAMIRANEGIYSIVTPFIGAYIKANDATDNSVDDGAIRKLVVTTHVNPTLGDPTPTEEVIPWIYAQKIEKVASDDVIDFDTDFTGELVVAGDMAGTIRIGGVLASGASIKVPTNGLKGQILMNAANSLSHLLPTSGAGDPDYYWLGSVKVNGTAINKALYYEVATSTHGGGSIAVGPFYQHRADCSGWPTYFGEEPTPVIVAQTSLSGIGGQSLQPLVVSFYGRLVAGSNLGAIEKWNGTAWVDANTMFDMSVNSAAPRDLVITGRRVGYPSQHIPVPNGKYRVIQGTGSRTLRSLDSDPSSGVQPATSLFWQYFCVAKDCSPKNGVPDVTDCSTGTCTTPVSGCIADADNGSGTGTPDGGVDINDLIYFLAAFEAGSQNADISDGTNCGTAVDGGVDINDLLCFLDHFELGC